jgi:hypothetical protein
MTAKVRQMSWGDYCRMPGEHWSVLKNAERSMAHYQWASACPREDTDELRFGRVVDILALEPERFDGLCAIWRGKVRNGKEWEAFQEANAGREILTANANQKALALGRAIRESDTAREYLSGGQSKLAISWEAEGVQCKAQLDYAVHGRHLADLKTTADASREAFERSAYSLGYYGQAAFYTDAWKAATGEVLPFFLVVAEKEPPFCVTRYALSPEALGYGRGLYRELLRRVRACRGLGVWPGLPQGDVGLPRYAVSHQHSDSDAPPV